MGRRGKPRTPTSILKLRGSRLTTYMGRGVGEPEPAPEDKGAPRRPAWLARHGAEAVRCWDYNVPILARMGVLAHVDLDALARYCVLWARWREAADYVAKNGPTMESLKGGDADNPIYEVKDHPAMARTLRLNEQLSKLEAKFGMTPSDRANMAKPPAAPRDELDEILGERKSGVMVTALPGSSAVERPPVKRAVAGSMPAPAANEERDADKA